MGCRFRRTKWMNCCCFPAGSVDSRASSTIHGTSIARRCSRSALGVGSSRSRPRYASRELTMASLLRLRRVMATTTWQPVTLVKCVSVKPWLVVPGDDEPGGCHDLTLGKIYECLGVEGRGSFLRIVDDSGDDFLYPLSHFREV